MFFVLSRAWDKENSESPWGIEPQTFGFRASMQYRRAYGEYYEVPNDTRPTYC